MKNIIPPILNHFSYKLTPPPFTKKFHPPYKASFENLHSPFIKGEGVQTMDLYIETNIHSSILFSSPPF